MELSHISIKPKRWKPPIKLSDYTLDCLKNCRVKYNLLENPFSKKFQSYDAAIEKELWDSLGIVGTSDDDQNFGKLSMENLFYQSSIPALHSKREIKRIRKAERKQKLEKWHDMPRRDPTTEDYEDLELIALRRAVSTSTHVKRSDSKSAYFERGVIIDDPGSFYDRIPRKQRRKNIVDELLTNADLMRNQRKRYGKLVQSMSDKRAAVRRQTKQRNRRLNAKGTKKQATVVVPTK